MPKSRKGSVSPDAGAQKPAKDGKKPVKDQSNSGKKGAAKEEMKIPTGPVPSAAAKKSGKADN